MIVCRGRIPLTCGGIDLPQRNRVDSRFAEQLLGGQDELFARLLTGGEFSGRLIHD
jgi:hypothetical protein